MEGPVTLPEVIRYIEVKNNISSLEFKKRCFSSDDDKLDRELSVLDAELRVLESKLAAAEIEVAFPFEEDIDKISGIICSFPPEAIKEALKKRVSILFEVIQARAALIKENQLNRDNIAKLAILISKLDRTTNEKILSVVRLGKVTQKISLRTTEQYSSKHLSTLFSRLKISATISDDSISPSKGDSEPVSQVPVKLKDRFVWVSNTISEKLRLNIQKIQEINPKIQLKNAERQIRVFDDQEEKDFQQMQMDYLSLLKEQDDLLKDFYDEERITFNA